MGLHANSKASETVVVRAPPRLFQYLDDWLNLFRSILQAKRWTNQLVSLCQHLGLLVNLEKSELEPTQVIVFLGEKLDLVQGRAFFHGGASARSHPTTIRSKRTSWPSVSKGRVSAGTDVSHSAHHSARQVTHETIPVGRHSASAKRKRLRCMGTGHRPVSQALEWWTEQSRWLEGVPFQGLTRK